MPTYECPLCAGQHTHHYYEDEKRHFYQCSGCNLVFVAPAFLPDATREKAEYDLHENCFDDAGYRRFLSRAMSPIIEHISPPATGLDFGCGPSPVLADMLSRRGYTMQFYDPIYARDSALLKNKYNFITCTEAIEHFHQPAKELRLLTSLLKPSGILVIMTKRVESLDRFRNWHYKNDQTHVSFFSTETFRFIGTQYGFSVTEYGKDVVLLKKHS